MDAAVADLAAEARHELGRILRYWLDNAVDPRGGFIGFIDADGTPDPGAPRGAILTSRILWTFAAAYRRLGEAELRVMADRALNEVLGRFRDPEHGGVYWLIGPDGRPVDDRKHVYAQAFAVYALAEHHRATGHESSLEEAIGLFRLIEEHASDPGHGGYLESFDRDWRPRDDDRLSDVDLAVPRSENAHLHLLEAYTTLVHAWRDPAVIDRLRALTLVFLDRIVDREAGHTRPFFDRYWTARSTVVSFGHDIETAWLLRAAARALGEPGFSDRTTEVALRLAGSVLEDGLDPAGGVYYEVSESGVVDRDKEWWTQAEAVVGFIDAYQATGRAEFLAAAQSTWRFITAHVVDHEGGEWSRRVSRDGSVRAPLEKVGPWKGPYHNARACLEVMERAGMPGEGLRGTPGEGLPPQ